MFDIVWLSLLAEKETNSNQPQQHSFHDLPGRWDFLLESPQMSPAVSAKCQLVTAPVLLLPRKFYTETSARIMPGRNDITPAQEAKANSCIFVKSWLFPILVNFISNHLQQTKDSQRIVPTKVPPSRLRSNPWPCKNEGEIEKILPRRETSRGTCQAQWHSAPPQELPAEQWRSGTLNVPHLGKPGLFAPLVPNISQAELQKATLGLQASRSSRQQDIARLCIQWQSSGNPVAIHGNPMHKLHSSWQVPPISAGGSVCGRGRMMGLPASATSRHPRHPKASSPR